MLSILTEEINKLEGLIAYHERLLPSVSAASVGWHIDHSLRAIIGMSKALQKSDPAQYRPKLSWSGWWVQMLGWFPRGRGQAPAAVVTTRAVTPDSLHSLVQAGRQMLTACAALPATSHFKHPAFGIHNKAQTIRLMIVHTRHHRRIIRDILAG